MNEFPSRRALLGMVLGAAMTMAFPALAQTQTMKMASATIGDVQHEWLKRFEAEIKLLKP